MVVYCKSQDWISQPGLHPVFMAVSHQPPHYNRDRNANDVWWPGICDVYLFYSIRYGFACGLPDNGLGQRQKNKEKQMELCIQHIGIVLFAAGSGYFNGAYE